ncbi:MAG TPA: hypothetical protein VN317_03730 [Candidatus Methanoperedens sp.]|nr:hypothetical protein [Candidatus Methanoperedens sp.]
MNSVNSSPVCFQNAEGLKLYGIVHRPAEVAKRQGIIICNPGIKSRVGPHRLYLAMAARFCELGFSVLRFDPEGLGDSEGQITDRLTADVLGSIEYGRLVKSTLAAMNWMERECRTSEFILTGLCGGAITGLLTAKSDARVRSLLGLGIPVISASLTVDPLKFMTDGQLGTIREAYVRKVFTLKPWIRFLTLQTDYKSLARSLLQPLKKKLRPKSARNEDSGALAAVPAAEESNVNRYFAPAFFEMMSSGRPMLLIFSSADRLYWEWEEKFARHYGSRIAAYPGLLEIHVTKDANHIFSSRESQEDMLGVACNWLERHFPI